MHACVVWPYLTDQEACVSSVTFSGCNDDTVPLCPEKVTENTSLMIAYIYICDIVITNQTCMHVEFKLNHTAPFLIIVDR